MGPAGAHFGMLACLIVEVLGSWPVLRHPRRALAKLLGLALSLFLIGLLPWIDNFAHAFGFVFGFLLSYALLPFVTIGRYERRRKVVLVWVCLASVAGFLCALVVLFYVAPAYECTICAYFTCLPFAPDMCASQDVRVRQMDAVWHRAARAPPRIYPRTDLARCPSSERMSTFYVRTCYYTFGHTDLGDMCYTFGPR